MMQLQNNHHNKDLFLTFFVFLSFIENHFRYNITFFIFFNSFGKEKEMLNSNISFIT